MAKIIQKCSGYACAKREECLHYAESKSKRKTRGSWINADHCIHLMYSELKVEGKKMGKIDLYDDVLEVELDENLELIDFTAIYGDKIYQNLKKHIKRDPTQYEFDANIDIAWEDYKGLICKKIVK